MSSLDNSTSVWKFTSSSTKKNERVKYLNPMNRLTQRFNMLAREKNERSDSHPRERIGFES